MSRRGVLFAVDEDTVQSLLAAASDEEVLEVMAALEDEWDEAYLTETDQAWDAMHRTLTDGTLGRGPDSGPLGWTILGGKQLHQGPERAVSLVYARDVAEVTRALAALDEEAFRERYFSVVPPDYSPEYGDEDAGFAWANLRDVARLYELAAAEGRAVVFKVDLPLED